MCEAGLKLFPMPYIKHEKMRYWPKNEVGTALRYQNVVVLPPLLAALSRAVIGRSFYLFFRRNNHVTV